MGLLQPARTPGRDAAADREQVGTGEERERAGPVGSPRVQTLQVLPASCSSPGRRPASPGRPNPQGPRRHSRVRGWGRRRLVPRSRPRPAPSPPEGSTHVSLHERPHEAAVHGSSGRACPRSAPRRPAQRAHGPGPECGRAPPPGSRPGRAGRCGGRPRPLSAHARPGPRRPARWWLLRGSGFAPGLLAVWLRAGSFAARADPAAAPLLGSAPLLCSLPLSPSPPPAAPPSPASGCPVPARTSLARLSMRPAPRGPRPAL